MTHDGTLRIREIHGVASPHTRAETLERAVLPRLARLTESMMAGGRVVGILVGLCSEQTTAFDGQQLGPIVSPHLGQAWRRGGGCRICVFGEAVQLEERRFWVKTQRLRSCGHPLLVGTHSAGQRPVISQVRLQLKVPCVAGRFHCAIETRKSQLAQAVHRQLG